MSKLPLKIYFYPIILFALFSCLLPFNQPLKISAADNDFLLAWSSASYVPQEYKGRALPSNGSLVKVFALPTKDLARSQESFYYRWLLDNELAYSANGQAKSYFNFTITKWGGDKHEVECQILDSDENIIWRGFLTIGVVDPEVLLKTGTSNYALSDSLATNTGRDLNFTAWPLFFRAQQPSDLTFEWTLDQQTLSANEGKNPNYLTIKIPSGKLSESLFKNLSLLVKNKADELQQLRMDLIIEIK